MNEELAKFLIDESRPKKTMNYPMLHGFLFTIACSPEMVSVSEWMPFIFDQEDAQFKTKEEKERIEGEILDILRGIEESVNENKNSLPEFFQPAENIMENFDEDSYYAFWGRGFLFGHNVLSEMWNAYLPSEIRGQQTAFVNTLGFFSSKILAEQIRKASGNDNVALDVMAESILDNFELAMNGYASIAVTIRNAIDEYGAKHPDA